MNFLIMLETKAENVFILLDELFLAFQINFYNQIVITWIMTYKFSFLINFHF